MRKNGRLILGVVAAVALLALVLPSVGSVVASDSGRNNSRCVQTCNQINKMCGLQCQTDCRAIYNTKQERDACIQACKDVCYTEMLECKLVCQEIKHNPSPECP